MTSQLLAFSRLHLFDPVQARPIERNLVIHGIGLHKTPLASQQPPPKEKRIPTHLASNPINMLILLIHLPPHRPAQLPQPPRRALQRVQIPINLILQLLVLAIGLELVLAALGEIRRLVRTARDGLAVHVARKLGLALLRAEGFAAGGFALLALRVVLVHDGLVAGFAALAGGEGVGDVHAGEG